VAEVHAARVLAALPGTAEPALRDRLTSALEQDDAAGASTASFAGGGAVAPLDWVSKELLRRDGEVREGLAALKSGVRPRHEWRTPYHRSHRLAGEAGLRAGLWMAMVSACLVLSGWPLTDVALTQVAVLIGLGATTPNPRGFTVLGLIVTPIAAMLAGVLEFVVLGVTQFPLLAMGLAPFVMGSVLVMTLPNQVLSALGRLSLIFMLVIFGPSNPQIYNPEVFLDVSLFVGLAAALLLMAQVLIPPLSDERRRQWLLGSARHELDRLPSRSVPRYGPEEAMFRDAVRIRQIAGEGALTPQDRAVLQEAVALFDQAGVMRLCEASLARLAGDPLAGPAEQARKALATRDAQAIRHAALALHDTAAKDALLAASHVKGPG
jgi:fusaric acid resistance family protein